MLQGLNHITVSTTNLERSFAFYTKVLGAKPRVKWRYGAYFEIGDVWFCINVDENTTKEITLDYTHLAFTVSQEDFEVLCARIKEYNVRLWQDNTSEGDSLYILDPDLHKLELHVGNLSSRMRSMNEFAFEDLEFF